MRGKAGVNRIRSIYFILLFAGQLFFFSHAQAQDLQAMKEELLLQQARKVRMQLDYQSLGGLDIYQGKARAQIPFRSMDWTFQGGYGDLEASDKVLVFPSIHEGELLLQTEFSLLQDKIELHVGGNVREQPHESLVSGGGKWTHPFENMLDVYLKAGFNDMSYETSALRALGSKDTVLLGLNGNPAIPVMWHVEADVHRYQSRKGSTLGEGYKLNLILGQEVLPENPLWQFRLQGSWEQNHLKDELPAELKRFLSASSGVDTVVPPEYGTVGIGTTIRYGSSPQGFVKRPFLLVDLWAGGTWPANQVAYNGRMGVGVSPLGPDVIRLDAFYGNVQGGVAGQEYLGVGLQYTYRF